MVWDDTQTEDTSISYEEWNGMVGYIKALAVGSTVLSTIVIDNATTGFRIYAHDGITILLQLDNNGNLGLKGMVYTL